MKQNQALLVLACLLSLMMSCQWLTAPTPAQTTPSRQVQMTQAAPTLPPTTAPDPTRRPIPSPTPAGPTASVSVSEVAGTHWVGQIFDQDKAGIWEVFEIIFLPEGKLRYYVPNDWHEDGAWTQKGNDITLETGNGACNYYGVLYGDAISGARKCGDGKTWGWSVQLKIP